MNPLLKILDEKLLPWACDEKDRLILAGSPPRKAELPSDMRVTKKIPGGPRKLMRGWKSRYDPSNVTAIWPEDGLEEFAGVPRIACIYNGRVDFWAGEIVIHCGQGYFILLPAGIPHDSSRVPHYDYDSNGTTEGQFCDLLWIGRFGSVLRIWTCHCVGEVHLPRPKAHANFLNDTANTLMDQLMEHAAKAGCQEVCRDRLYNLLLLLQRDLRLGKILGSSRIGPPTAFSPETDPIDRAQEFVRYNLHSALSIDAVCRQVGISRSQFTRLFRRKTGVTFVQFVTACRVDEAKRLLLDTNWSLHLIAEHVGLNSASYFSRTFSAFTGMSPQVFRGSRAGNATTPKGARDKKSQ